MRMSVSRRRGHLFGIFYYRTPDAQARRIDKMLDDANALAEKLSNKKKLSDIWRNIREGMELVLPL